MEDTILAAVNVVIIFFAGFQIGTIWEFRKNSKQFKKLLSKIRRTTSGEVSDE